MKRFMLIFAAAGMLASCSNDEVVEVPTTTTAIGFDQAHVNNSTRGGIATTATSLQTTGFLVWGDMVNPSNGTTDVASIFEGTEISYDNSSWTYSPLRYWIATNNYAFSAFGPGTTTYLSFDESSDVYSNFLTYYRGTVTWSNTTGTEDLVYAFATVENAAANQGAVSFTFNHLLSRVRLQFDNCFTSDGVELKISGVSMTAATGGTLALSNYANSVLPANFVWAPDSTTNITYKFPTTNSNTTSLNASSSAFTNRETGSYGAPAGAAVTDYFYLTPNQTSLTVNFTVELISNGVTAETYVHSVPVILSATTTHNSSTHGGTTQATTLQPGYSYTLIADLSAENVDPKGELYPITFAVSGVNSFQNWTDREYEFPSDDKN